MSIQDKVRSIILSRTTDQDNRKIGIEEECILHTSENKRLPVNRGNSFSAIDLLNIINDKKKNAILGLILLCSFIGIFIIISFLLWLNGLI